jgi:DNA-binding beta-propeller fold protein YncE
VLLRLRWIALVGGILAAVVASNTDAAVTDGRVGPAQHLLGNGRHLTPPGQLVPLGNFPTGGALTPDGRFYWTVSTGRGLNDIRIVSVATSKVIQVLPIPGASGGIVMDPVRRLAYVSGVPDSEHKDAERIGLPGREGDVIHVFSYATSGKAHFSALIPVPPPDGAPDVQGFVPLPGAPRTGIAPPPQNFPPQDTINLKESWPGRLAISHDGRMLLVPLNLADAAAIVDVPTKHVRYVPTGNYPYGAAIQRDGKTGLVSNETPGTVSVIDLVAGTKLKDIVVGSHLSHPEAIALDPVANRAYVTVANTDQVVVIDTGRLEVERTLSVARSEGNGTSPVALTVTPDATKLLVALAGSDEIAVFRLPNGARAKPAAQRRAERILNHEARAAAARAPSARGEPEDGGRQAGIAQVSTFPLIGRIPVASYPADVQAAPANANACTPVAGRKRQRSRRRRKPRRLAASTSRRRTASRAAVKTCPKLLWIAGKGLGVGPNPQGPNPYKIDDNNALSMHYLPSIVNGNAGLLDFPSDARIAALTRDANRQLLPSNAQAAPPGTPLGPGGPIKHVFYIVKENRTYDQVLGDDHRGDGDASIALFGRQVTPNHHALAERFPLLDHVYANSEASIDGHFWASAAKVSDYVHKNWNQNYGARKRPYDFGAYAVTWPEKGFIFDQLDRQGISYFNFGEPVAGVVPLADKDRTPEEAARVDAKYAKSDLGAVASPGGCYANSAFIFKNGLSMNPVSDSSPVAGMPANTESRFDCFRTKFNAQLATNGVPAFTFLVVSQDHTQGGKGNTFTPRAYVANNDYALGQMVDLISHSPVWNSSAIFVIEDDSQDGADHVDAHRMPAYVISPYAKRGAVVHRRYDMLSAIRSMELILGMQPLGLFDAVAVPMFDAFDPTPGNGEPYSVIQPTWNLVEKNSPTSAAARMSRNIDFNRPDQIHQDRFDRIIWKATYGDKAEPPPPGPNAAVGQ